MANTIMSAKNTFTEGLIMDFAPDNTQATCLTSALNATLLTFNGNELSLLNDMGNGRVETAMLPEGYIPVGTCEFGDIIYIVSYNPLTDKSLIGCFPSPERNISSDEISDLGQQLSYTDFLDVVPNGELKNTTAKKVLLSKNVNPGDKYVIYTNLGCLTGNNILLTPEDKNAYVRLSVISIDDTGKITELDTELKEFFIKERTNVLSTEDLPPDIDSYRNLLQSGWNIFTSKVSGKLAILAELIMPESFSCEYYIDEITEEGYSYKITLEPTFEGNVKAPMLWTNVSFDGLPNINISEINNGIIDIRIEKGHEKDTCILEVCPVMPYGIIDSLKLTFTIDFSKIGTGEIELTRWKYFNQENVSTLSYGFNAYLRDKETIDSVVMHFYDANGLVAEYKLKDADINSGIYTENIGLNGNAINAALSKYKTTKDGEDLIKHKKTDEIFERANDDSNDLKDDDNYYCINKVGDDGNFILEDGKLKYYLNDAGILYSNMLYLVKINIATKREIIGGNGSRDIPLYRWFWTTSMYNEYYHSIDDFNILKFQLSLSADVVYETNNDTYKWETKEINNLEKPIEESNSANILYIENKTSGNINAYIRPGLQNDYDCFKLYRLLKNDNGEVEKDNFENFTVDIYFGENILNNTNATLYDFSDRDTGVIKGDFMKLEDSTTPPNTLITIPESLETSPQNSFNVLPIDTINEGDYEYSTDENGNKIVEYIHITKGLNDFYYVDKNDKQALPLNLQAVLFNKAYAAEEYSTKITKPVYVPIINDLNDLDLLGLTFTDTKLGFKMAMNLSQHGEDFSATNIYQNNLIFDTPNGDDKDNLITKTVNINPSLDIDFIDNIWYKIKDYMPIFFPVYLGGHGGDSGTSTYLLTQGDKNVNIKEEWAKERTCVRNWYSEDSNNGGKSRLTNTGKRVFDITEDGKLDFIYGSDTINNTGPNHITFLGVKYKDGMTLINTAMVDNTGALYAGMSPLSFVLYDDTYKKSGYDTYYANFAALLYLILSNTYHKNKRTDDKEINIKNFVRNSQYEALLKKTIYYRLTASNSDELDIAMHNMSFNNYVTKFLSIKEVSADWKSIKNNVTLDFVGYLHLSSLQIDVKSLPMSFLNAEQDAYFLRNGNLIGTYNLGGDQFYIYKEGSLEPFLSKGDLLFDVASVDENIKYLTKGESTSWWDSMTQQTILIKTDENREKDLALYIIADYIDKNRDAFTHEVTTLQSPTTAAILEKVLEVITYAKGKINEMYAYFESLNITVNNKSIKSLIDFKIEYKETAHGANYYNIDTPGCSGMIEIKYINYNDAHFAQQLLVCETFNKNKYRDVFYESRDGYYIKLGLNLTRNFIYDDGLILNPVISHSYFGVRDIGKKYGYTGFLQDVILDTDYQIK